MTWRRAYLCMHFVLYYLMLSQLRYQVCFYAFKIAGFFVTGTFFHLIRSLSLCKVRFLKLSSENVPADGWKKALRPDPYHCRTYKSREYRPALQEILDCSFTCESLIMILLVVLRFTWVIPMGTGLALFSLCSM